jgi:ATP-dependent Clp protease adaptor protein ClpS
MGEPFTKKGVSSEPIDNIMPEEDVIRQWSDRHIANGGMKPTFSRDEIMADHAAAVISEESTETAIPERQKREKGKPKKQPRYNVVLWNDDDHSYEYVITMLLELFSHPIEKGYQMAVEVDTQGRVIVLTTTMEHAELKRDQIHAYGKDVLISGCKGSMSATIEPVDD